MMQTVVVFWFWVRAADTYDKAHAQQHLQQKAKYKMYITLFAYPARSSSQILYSRGGQSTSCAFALGAE